MPRIKSITCKICGIEKTTENCYMSKQGYFSNCCRNCENATNRIRHEKNKEKDNERIKKRYYKLRNADPYFIKLDDQKARGVKNCTVCKEEKKYEEFYTEKTGRISSRCKICFNNAFKTWKQENKPRLRECLRKYKLRQPAKYLLRICRIRARRKDLEYNLQLSDIQIPTHCPVLGIPITLGGERFDSPTIDRIDNTKGYIPTNIIVISYRANSLKKDSSLEERQKLVDFYSNIEENRQKIKTMELLEQNKKKRTSHLIQNVTERNIVRREEYKHDIEFNMIIRARQRAKKNNLEFSITERDIRVTKFCPIFETELSIGLENIETSPSLERIDCSKGYTPDNIIVISYRANRAKGNATLEELILINNFYKNL